MAKVKPLPSGCWHWTGEKHRKGYGYFTIDKRRVYAHRWAYEHFIGPIPDGMTIDHLCHNEDADCPGGNGCLHRSCVNPAHLAPATVKQNVLRGKGSAADRARQMYCKRGHPLSGDNVRITKRGYRECRRCAYEHHRAYVEAHRDHVLAVRHRWLANPANRERVRAADRKRRPRHRAPSAR